MSGGAGSWGWVMGLAWGGLGRPVPGGVGSRTRGARRTLHGSLSPPVRPRPPRSVCVRLDRPAQELREPGPDPLVERAEPGIGLVAHPQLPVQLGRAGVEPPI